MTDIEDVRNRIQADIKDLEDEIARKKAAMAYIEVTYQSVKANRTYAAPAETPKKTGLDALFTKQEIPGAVIISRNAAAPAGREVEDPALMNNKIEARYRHVCSCGSIRVNREDHAKCLQCGKGMVTKIVTPYGKGGGKGKPRPGRMGSHG